MRSTNCLRAVLLVGLAVLSALNSAADEASPSTEQLRQRGAALYMDACADCHGDQGQGMESGYEDPLAGDESIGQLTRQIVETMPEGSPEECVGDDARAISEYMHHAFYGEAAQIRNRPPHKTFSRLTASQLRQSFSDLYAQFDGLPEYSDERGLEGVYFNGTRWKDDQKKIERIDPVIDFDFGHDAPADGIDPESFYLHWEGGLLAETTGRYEIVVRSTCSLVLTFGRDERKLINNRVQSGDKTEFRRTMWLTGGRVYPINIDFKQRKRKTELPPARVSLSWVPPDGVEQIIPSRNLLPVWVPPAYALQTVLPPDDNSYGYQRGIAVSRQWDEAVTAAAIEFSQIAYDELWPSYQHEHRKDRSENGERPKLRGFLTELVETAFRTPLSDELNERFIDKQMAREPDDAEAIKRVLLLALKSPRFLYPTAVLNRSSSQSAASRLALVLFDSLPTDDWLRGGAAKGDFDSADEIRSYAEDFVDDYRVRAKTLAMLHSWLNLERFTEITKNDVSYPGFDHRLVSDLRLSLDAFLDDIVWSDTSDYRQIFLASYSFTTPRITDFYGGDGGEHWQPKEDRTGVGRTVESEFHLGLVAHPYLMSGLAYHDTSSPIHRGVFFLRYMLGRTMRPPADAFSPLSPDLHPALTTRERVHLQTSPASCQACHVKINGLGFILENYDAAGRYRSEDKGKPVDAKGSYTNRSGDELEFLDPRELAQFLAHSEDAQRAFISRAFQHFAKQPPAAYGANTLDELLSTFRESDCSIRKLIVEIAVIVARPNEPFDIVGNTK